MLCGVTYLIEPTFWYIFGIDFSKSQCPLRLGLKHPGLPGLLENDSSASAQL